MCYISQACIVNACCRLAFIHKLLQHVVWKLSKIVAELICKEKTTSKHFLDW